MMQFIKARPSAGIAMLLCLLTFAPLSFAQAPLRSGDAFDGIKDTNFSTQLFLAQQEYEAFLGRGQNPEDYVPQSVDIPFQDGLVTIEVSTSGDPQALLASLQDMGMVDTSVYGRIVGGRLPIGMLSRVDALPDVLTINDPVFVTNRGRVTSQGDVSMRSDVARAIYGIDGSGVTVGTLSNSYDCLNQAAGNVIDDDLPAGVVVLEEANCPTITTAIDEGRAMMQLIHDVAPGTTQLYHTAFATQANFANGILDLAAAGADVIVDDIIYLAEPMFQDGIVADAVDTVAANGVSYFSSAGNNARQSYEAPFRSTGIDFAPGNPSFTGDAHDFNPSSGVDNTMRVTVGAGGAQIVLQWDQPYASVSGTGSNTDLDILAYNTSGTLVGGSANNNLNGDPVELFSLSQGTYDLVIEKFTGAGSLPNPSRIKFVWFGSMTINQYATNSASSYGHANAEGAIGVGAAWYFRTPAFGTNPPLLEGFSSAGGTPIFYLNNGTRVGGSTGIIRNKPEITSVDGTNTTFFGSNDPEEDGFPNFFGTSAAAPHAAAVAALMLEANDKLTNSDILTALQNTAIDMETPGFDFDSGFGFIQADDAVAAVIPAPGDCNVDGAVNSSDVSFLRDEIFDGDGTDARDVPGGTVDGGRFGCDSNGDDAVNAGDLACVLLILNGDNSCTL